jgi:hypothetical protein
MIKKIPCRIVSSKPLDKVSNTLFYVRTSNNPHHRINRIFNDKYIGNLITYTRLLEITTASMDNIQAGRILDCYV